MAQFDVSKIGRGGSHADHSAGMHGSKEAGTAEKSKEGHSAGGAEPPHSTQPHPETGVHEIHIKHHGGGRYSVHAFHEAIGPHHEAAKAEITHHDGSGDAYDHAQTHFPPGEETPQEEAAESLHGMMGSPEET